MLVSMLRSPIAWKLPDNHLIADPDSSTSSPCREQDMNQARCEWESTASAATFNFNKSIPVTPNSTDSWVLPTIGVGGGGWGRGGSH